MTRALARERGRTTSREVPTAGPVAADGSTARAWCCWRPQPTPASTSATSPRSPPPRTRPARSSPSTTPPPPRSASARWSSAPTSRSPATPRRSPAQRPAARPRQHRRRRAGRPAARGCARAAGAGPGPVRGLARAPLAAHARPAAGPAGRQRRRGRRGAARAPGRRGVRWPGRPDDPSYDLARRQMRRPNGVVAADLARPRPRWAGSSPPRGCRRRPPASAACARSADRRQQWGDAVPPGFVRLSVRLRGHRRPGGRPARRPRRLDTVPYHTRVTHPGYGLIRAGRWSREASEIRPTRPRRWRPRTRGGAGGTPSVGVLPIGSRVLLLNATFEPLAVVTAKRAVVLMLTGKAECVRGHPRRGLPLREPHPARAVGDAPLALRARALPRRRPHDPRGRPAPRRAPLRLLRPSGRHHRSRRTPQPRRRTHLGELRRGLPRCATPGRPTGSSASSAGPWTRRRARPAAAAGGVLVLAVEPLPAWEPWLAAAA